MKFFIITIIGFTLILNACSSTSESINVNIIGTEWILAEIKTETQKIVLNRKSPEMKRFETAFTLHFDAERLSGVGAPNRYFGPYKLGKNQTIKVQPLGSTLMASLVEFEKLKEHEYFNYLQNAYKWNIVNGRLELHTRSGNAETVLIYNLNSK